MTKRNILRQAHSIGRSMIEMLGVLAIIGVLSIGGLYAYRQAMNRYKANMILELISYIKAEGLSIDQKTDIEKIPSNICSGIGFNPELCKAPPEGASITRCRSLPFGFSGNSGYWCVYQCTLDDCDYYITLVGLIEPVCRTVVNALDTNAYVIYIGNHSFRPPYDKTAMANQCADADRTGWGKGVIQLHIKK